MAFKLIRKRQNLLTYSEDFLTGWSQIGTGTPVANSIIAPDGTLTADTLDDTDSTSDRTYYELFIATVEDDTTTRIFTLRLKEGTAAETDIRIYYTGGTTAFGSATITWASHSVSGGTIEDVDNGWYEVSVIVANNATGNTACRARIYPAGDAGSVTGTVYAWGASMAESSVVVPYVKTEASAITDTPEFLTVTPEYDYVEPDEKIESRHRARSGTEYVYKWGEFKKFNMGVMYVNSEFKSVVNSWWSSNTDLLWMDSTTNVTSVHLTNKKKPIDKRVKPYTDKFKGKLELGTY